LNICFYLCNITYCQVIKGKVFDSSTNKEIKSASVYFNGTFVGTTTDKVGNFELDITKNRYMPLTISAIGYYSVTLEQFSIDKILEVMLSPKTYMIKEAKVNAKSLQKKRKTYLKLFKEEFLGYDYETMNCFIENENDITFNYDSDKDTLKAYARNPIQIVNNGLGYKITYYMDKFVYCWKSSNTIYEGNHIFQDIVTVDSTRKYSFNKLRFSVFQGSRLQLFRALWADNLYLTKFIIRNKTGQILSVNDLVKQDKENKYFFYPRDLFVNYNANNSQLIFYKPVYFDKSGYFDGSALNWRGSIGFQRMADTLPNEYVAVDPEVE
jgi:hypothetical protein